MSVIRGDRVRQLRQAKRMSQTALGKKAGVSQSTISDMETGKHEEPRGVNEVARALETNTDYLWGNIEDPSPNLRAPLMKLDPNGNITPELQPGAITGDAQETRTESSTTSRILYVYGTSWRGVGVMNLKGAHIDQVLAPGYADDVLGAYYVAICTMDMVPAYWPGDELLIYPEHPVIDGRDYLLLSPKVEGQQQTCKVRYLKEITETHWVCTVWRPEEHEERLPREEYPLAHWVESKRNRR